MVMLIGRTIESAIQEQEQVSDGEGGKKFVFKYTLSQILDPEFRFNGRVVTKKEPTPATKDTKDKFTEEELVASTGTIPYIDTKVFRNTRGSIMVDSV